MTVTVASCSRCHAVDVEREIPVGRFAGLAAKIPVLCDLCIAAVDAEDAARREVDAAEDRAFKTERRTKDSGLPARHHVTLASLDLSAPLLEAASSWVRDGGGLLLTGEIGRGKTTIAGSACWERLHSKPVIWTSAPLLMARLGSGLNSEAHQWAVGTLASRHGLVLDDIDKARPTEYGAEQVFLAVDQRVEHEAPLLVTSNLAPSQLAERWPGPYGEAIASRLVGYCKVLKVDGVDRRLQLPEGEAT